MIPDNKIPFTVVPTSTTLVNSSSIIFVHEYSRKGNRNLQLFPTRPRLFITFFPLSPVVMGWGGWRPKFEEEEEDED